MSRRLSRSAPRWVAGLVRCLASFAVLAGLLGLAIFLLVTGLKGYLR